MTATAGVQTVAPIIEAPVASVVPLADHLDDLATFEAQVVGPETAAPHVADATEPINATRGDAEVDRQKWGPNVKEFPASATRGTPHVAQSASSCAQSRLPKVKWFTFERRKVSKNTWAYCARWHELDSATGSYRRVPPIYVRRVSDATDIVLRRRDNETLKRLVRSWYEQKIGQRFVAAN